MDIKSFVLSPFQSNCYVLSESAERGARAVIIDPGDTDVQSVLDYVDKQGLQVEAVWATHAHLDHVMGVDVVRDALSVPAFVHTADAVLWSQMPRDAQRMLKMEVPELRPPDGYFEEGESLYCGPWSFKVWHTPGHSRGSVCFVGDEIAFTGDTLFAQGIGRTDLPGGSFPDIAQSLKRLMTLPDDVRIYPGHMGASTIGLERKINPFLLDLE